MKSSVEEMKKRGYIEDTDLNNYLNLTLNELIELIKSQKAYERTIAVRLLGKSNTFVEAEISGVLIAALANEKSLYTKIEICKVLEKKGICTAQNMTLYLGRIGNNQYHSLPEKVSKKISYPLPRDIIARTLGKMNIGVLPVLLQVLGGGDITAIREVIDAIGFMCFYNRINKKEWMIDHLFKCFRTYKDDAIIRWKVVMAFSAFHDDEVVSFLNKISEMDDSLLIKNEAKRSLAIIKKNTRRFNRV